MTIEETTARDRSWRRYAPLAILMVVLAGFFCLGFDRWLSLDMLIRRHAALRAWAGDNPALAASAFMALYAFLVAISAPGATLLTIAGGAIFGLGFGAAVSAVGATLGACALFLAARSSLGLALAMRAGPAVTRLRDNFCDHATGYLLFLRLSPLFPFWFVNLAAALAGVKFRTFLWTTALGILPASIVFAGAGASLDGLADAAMAAREACLARGQAECRLSLPLSAIVTPQIFILLIGLSLVALAPALAKRVQAARRERPEA